MQRTEFDEFEFDPDRFQARADASCLSKLLIISNESPVLNSFSLFFLLPPFLFLILFLLSAFSSFFFIPSSFQLNPTLPFNRIGMSAFQSAV
jgi:hypothetical protein